MYKLLIFEAVDPDVYGNRLNGIVNYISVTLQHLSILFYNWLFNVIFAFVFAFLYFISGVLQYIYANYGLISINS